MQCFRCDQPAAQECPRCGALYCDDHGDALCERCMDPASALPSYRVYRGSLVALLIGSVFAVWLLVRPGGETDQAGPGSALAAVLPSATPTKTPATPAPATTPTATPEPTAVVTPTATPSPTPTPPPARPETYRVQSGDTLSSIAEQFRGGTPFGTYLQRLYEANGMGESSILSVGDVIQIPPP